MLSTTFHHRGLHRRAQNSLTSLAACALLLGLHHLHFISLERLHDLAPRDGRALAAVQARPGQALVNMGFAVNLVEG